MFVVVGVVVMVIVDGVLVIPITSDGTDVAHSLIVIPTSITDTTEAFPTHPEVVIPRLLTLTSTLTGVSCSFLYKVWPSRATLFAPLLFKRVTIE